MTDIYKNEAAPRQPAAEPTHKFVDVRDSYYSPAVSALSGPGGFTPEQWAAIRTLESQAAAQPVQQPAPVAGQSNPHAATYPEEIWLNPGEANADECIPYTDGLELTWCWERIDSMDVRYVRADLAAHVPAHVPAARVQPGPFPERDQSQPAGQQGLFHKFEVRRVNGSDAPGGKHRGCRYFVLDMDHDQHAGPALAAYATSCAATHPALAAELTAQFGKPDGGHDVVLAFEQAAQACDQQADGTNGPYRSACLQCADAVRELRGAAAAKGGA
ncbi:hypothetical protein ASF61_06560 [Duganella sp. Leaf126]|uniref:hypothetical protein n=1 Tax=Duganella sp. Leaf126 TaxID=1736266 RepID=UPI0006F2E2ED|nr:hypothetical protein [Duganella sp. Leaf126]KQQ40413.1 hypothetical protein ASF61_06560 [Duganella sp. Leaf126]